MRHKLDVLHRHCDDIDRDPAEITKTWLGALVIAENQAEAEQRGRAMAQARGMDDERYRGYVVAGDPDRVCEQVGAYLDAGLDGLVFNMHDVHDTDLVRLAGEILTAAFG